MGHAFKVLSACTAAHDAKNKTKLKRQQIVPSLGPEFSSLSAPIFLSESPGTYSTPREGSHLLQREGSKGGIYGG